MIAAATSVQQKASTPSSAAAISPSSISHLRRGQFSREMHSTVVSKYLAALQDTNTLMLTMSSSSHRVSVKSPSLEFVRATKFMLTS